MQGLFVTKGDLFILAPQFIEGDRVKSDQGRDIVKVMKLRHRSACQTTEMSQF